MVQIATPRRTHALCTYGSRAASIAVINDHVPAYPATERDFIKNSRPVLGKETVRVAIKKPGKRRIPHRSLGS